MKIEIGSRKVVVEFCCRLGPKWPATWPKMAGDLLRRGRVSPATRRSSSSLFFSFLFPFFVFIVVVSFFCFSLTLFLLMAFWMNIFVCFFLSVPSFLAKFFFFSLQIGPVPGGHWIFLCFFFLNKIVFKDKWSSMTPVTGRRFFFLDSFDIFFFWEISTNFGWFVGRSLQKKT